MIGTASRQSVVRGISGRLFVRVMDDTTFAPYEVNANGHSCDLYDSNGGLVANASSGFSISEEHLTLTYLFSSSEWSLQDFCKAHFSISTTSGTIEREIYFSIVKRKFLSLLTSSDLFLRHPYLSAQLPTGASSLESYLQRAWERIENHLWLKMNLNPANIFHSEHFLQAHENLTLAEVFLSLAFDADVRNEDMAKYKIYERRGLEALELACSRVDLDLNEDGVQSPKNTRFLTHIRVVR